jgi:hypothetical protein
VTIAAKNWLAGKTGNTADLLRELTDEQLVEQAEHWAEREREYREIQPPTPGYSGSAYAAYRMTVNHSTKYRERERRWREHRDALDAMIEVSEEAGAYEATAKPERTR